MATVHNAKSSCSACGLICPMNTCSQCQKLFCIEHINGHGEQVFKKMENIKRENEQLRKDLNLQDTKNRLSTQISQWEKESIEKIRSVARQAQSDLNESVAQLDKRLSDFTKRLAERIYSMQTKNCITDNELDRWEKEFEKVRGHMKSTLKIQFVDDGSPPLHYIRVKNNNENEDNRTNSSSQPRSRADLSSTQVVRPDKSSQDDNTPTNKSKSSAQRDPVASESAPYLNIAFGLNQSASQNVQTLFTHLMQLEPMDKKGPMSGRCDQQTTQMEQFLERAFGFRNIPGQYIVQGVKAFELDRPLRSMDPKTVIHFPSITNGSFMMTAKEIVEWQRSYRVYASKLVEGMNEAFLQRALQGQSQDGPEAFCMKFVIRISTCPILMEFDAKIISRKLDEEWPHRIKLVSVTGIDFAGRKHDVSDILQYVLNWEDVYIVDRVAKRPALHNERDFKLRKDRKQAVLDQERLLRHLTYMAGLRLRACDEEGVQIVVETGIGLGVFAGEQIGIAEEVQITSALAIKTILAERHSTYKNILAVVFALPNFNEDEKNFRSSSTFSNFMEQFQDPEYSGRIPVLIADQDMHRLTVAIARHGFVVSQLNPADSHGVFGEYWQNRGPAVEEKLALTTLGLLVQHHLINKEVLNPVNYRIRDNFD